MISWIYTSEELIHFSKVTKFDSIKPCISVLETIDEASMKYLTSAFRVGILGLEALPRRADGQIKYRQSPLYADDVKWLWEVSVKLGNLLAYI